MSLAAPRPKPPWPYSGGKSRPAPEVWRRFGKIGCYCEPFAGSLAVLLARPLPVTGVETVNDKDGFIVNAWRAIQAAPEETAAWADAPVHELTMHANHRHLVSKRAELTERLVADRTYYDAELAGIWINGICMWIGGGWCAERETPHVKIPTLQNNGKGVHSGLSRQAPHLGSQGGMSGVHTSAKSLQAAAGAGDSGGRGVHQGEPSRQRPHMTGKDVGNGVHSNGPRPNMGGNGGGQGPHSPSLGGTCAERREMLTAWFLRLQDRLRRVRICSGDWSRIMGPAVLSAGSGVTGIFLDPPYSFAERDVGLYACEDDCGAAVRAWAIENGDNPQYRIALCGYDTEHLMPESWSVFHWRSLGGYSSGAKSKESRGNINKGRETIFFSPGCLKAHQAGLFDANGDHE